MKPLCLIVSIVAIVVLLAAACVSAPPPTPPATTSAALKPPPAAPPRWNTVMEAAQGEGSLVVYTTANPATTEALSRAFRDKYGITVEFMVGRGEELVQRIITENRAGIYLGDILLAGSKTLLITLKPYGILATLDSTLILPEVTDATRWRGNQLPFLDKEHYAIGFINQVSTSLAANNDTVKEGEIKSYRDLLDPRWKGRIVMDDPTVSGAASNWVARMFATFGEDGARQYLEQLVKQEPLVVRDKRLVVEWLARGKYAVLIGPDIQTVNEFKANGAPIRWIKASEGSASLAGGGSLALLGRAAHPNASLVFINWLLSKEGQTIFTKAFGSPSARLDVDTTGIEPSFIAAPGEKLVNTDTEEFLNSVNRTMEAAKQIFKSVLQG